MSEFDLIQEELRKLTVGLAKQEGSVERNTTDIEKLFKDVQKTRHDLNNKLHGTSSKVESVELNHGTLRESFDKMESKFEDFVEKITKELESINNLKAKFLGAMIVIGLLIEHGHKVFGM
jgi:predicted  nucleic acid-binding Zn-ribbon protein